LVAAWTVVQDSAAPREQRIQQGAALLGALGQLSPEVQAPFLLDVLGSDLWPQSLEPAFAALEQVWPKYGDRLLEDLVLPLPERKMRVHGVIRALGLLHHPSPRLVEGLASVLEREGLAAEARQSLARLTGREFGSRSDFSNWWQTAKEQDRADWLEAALADTQARELSDWRGKLAPNSGASPAPKMVVAGMKHPRASVRSLAYRALVGMDPAGLAEADATSITTALRESVQAESVAELRLELLPLVPRFLRNGEALSSLLRSLEFGSAREQLAAATNLQLVRPPLAAWNGLLRGLSRLYPEAKTEASEASASKIAPSPPSTPEVRTALWTGLLAVGRQKAVQDAVDTTELKAMLGRALVVEDVAIVRDRLFQAIGVYGDASFLAVLQPLVSRPTTEEGAPEVPTRQVPAGERRAALAAMTDVAAGGNDPGLLSAMLPELLEDPEVLVRDQAINSVLRLQIPNALELLAARLGREAEAPVLRHLLESLGGSRKPGILESLLAFQPPQAFHDLYAKAVQVQVDGDFPSLQKAYQVLSARLDWPSAFTLVRKCPHEGLNPKQLAELDRLYAQAESEHLLEVGVDKEFQSYAEEAVGLLQVLMGREGQDLRWPVYFVELQLMRGQVPDALTVMRTLVPNQQMPIARRWELGLDTLRFAAAQELWEDGRVLLAELDALGEMPEEMAYRADQVRQLFPPLETSAEDSVAGSEEAPGGGEGVPAPGPDDESSSQEPAVAEGGKPLPVKEPEAGTDPPPPDPPVEDPGNGGEQPPVEDPGNGGDGDGDGGK